MLNFFFFHVEFFDISSQSVSHSILGWGLLCKKLVAFYTGWTFNSFFFPPMQLTVFHFTFHRVVHLFNNIFALEKLVVG